LFCSALKKYTYVDDIRLNYEITNNIKTYLYS